MHDLKDQIHSFFETGLLPVAADDIAQRHRPVTAPFPAKARGAVTVRRVTTVGAVLAAAGCTAALVASQLSGAPASRPPRPGVVDAAYVRHLATASRLALATSGQAVLNLTLIQGQGQATNTQTSTYHLTFSGANWIDFLHFTETESGMRWVRIIGTRVVDGQAYMYRGPGSCGMPTCSPYWYHVTGPGAVSSMPVSDPRALLAELSPSAHFVRVGTAVVDGVRVEHLRATTLAGLPAISLPPPLTSGPTRFNHLTGLDVWVDDHGVVRRLAWSGMQKVMIVEVTGGQGHKQIKKSGEIDASAVVTFLDIGQPQVISVPPHALPAPPGQS